MTTLTQVHHQPLSGLRKALSRINAIIALLPVSTQAAYESEALYSMTDEQLKRRGLTRSELPAYILSRLETR